LLSRQQGNFVFVFLFTVFLFAFFVFCYLFVFFVFCFADE